MFKRITLAVVIVASLGVSSCKTGSSPDGGGGAPPIITGLENCAIGATHTAALTILDDAAAALATGNWIGALERLALTWGQAAVSCAVQQIAGDSAHAFQASGDALEGLKAERGRQYLATHPAPPTGS